MPEIIYKTPVFYIVHRAVRIILQKDVSIVDTPMRGDNYTSLHIAVANDFVEIAGLLLGVS